MRPALLVAIVLVAGGCGEAAGSDAGALDADALDAGVPGAVAIFDLERLESRALLSVPFPSDLYRDGAGAIALGPIEGARERGAIEAIRRLAAQRGGFCTTCAAHFPIGGALDTEAVPASSTAFDEASVADAVLLVDVDPASPERGRLFPLEVHWHTRAGVLAIRPAPGLVLAPFRRYCAVLTDRVRGADGAPVRASADFLAVRDGAVAGAGIDPAWVEAARAVVGPALDALEELGVPRARVVAIAPFTTADASGELQRVHALVNEGAAPIATVDRVIEGAALEDLLGTPAEVGPGIDAVPMAGTEGTRAMTHETTSLVVTGSFDAPRLVDGTGTDVGLPRRGPDGALALGPREAVPFVLIIPRGADLARLPVVVSLHGFSSSRVTGFALADTAGRANVAVLAIDYYQHGERAASAVDEQHAMRGELPGADGFAETAQLDVTARVFGFAGVARGTELSPEYPLGALLQFASDAMATLRLVREGDVSALRAASPALSTLAFDPERVFVVGNSLGAEVTSLVLAVDRDVAGAVMNVWPGGIVDNLVDSPEFRPIVESLLLPMIGVDGPFDEPERGLSLDLLVDLYRFSLEPADPLAMAPRLFGDPIGDAPFPDLLVQIGELDELASPRASEAAVAAAGLASSEPLRFSRTATASLPVSANLTTPAGDVTAICIRYADGGHGMMELRSQESRYVPPAIPPWALRVAPLDHDNPIDEVHAHIEQLLRTRTSTTRATIGE
jgi:hypothetical protein